MVIRDRLSVAGMSNAACSGSRSVAGYGATIRSIDVDGKPFSAPATDAPPEMTFL
jgi:hypothetical protein